MGVVPGDLRNRTARESASPRAQPSAANSSPTCCSRSRSTLRTAFAALSSLRASARIASSIASPRALALRV
jgi:hypothetical protein